MPIFEFQCEDPKCRHYKERFDVLESSFELVTMASVHCPLCDAHATRCVVPSSPASFRMGGAK